MQAASLVAVTAPTIAFFWTSDLNESLSALRPIAVGACVPLAITLVPNSQTIEPVAPFYFLAAPVGGVPTIVPTRASLDGTRFTFTPTYRVVSFTLPRPELRNLTTPFSQQGTTFMLAMVDSSGLSGGLVGNCTSSHSLAASASDNSSLQTSFLRPIRQIIPAFAHPTSPKSPFASTASARRVERSSSTSPAEPHRLSSRWFVHFSSLSSSQT